MTDMKARLNVLRLAVCLARTNRARCTQFYTHPHAFTPNILIVFLLHYISSDICSLLYCKLVCFSLYLTPLFPRGQQSFWRGSWPSWQSHHWCDPGHDGVTWNTASCECWNIITSFSDHQSLANWAEIQRSLLPWTCVTLIPIVGCWLHRSLRIFTHHALLPRHLRHTKRLCMLSRTLVWTMSIWS